MKKSHLLPIILLPLFALNLAQSHNDYALDDGESITFCKKNDREGTIRESTKRGSYDGTKYSWFSNSLHEIGISRNIACRKPNQSEIDICNCYGTASRNGDTLILEINPSFSKIFILKLGDTATWRYNGSIQIKLLASDLDSQMIVPRFNSYDFRASFYALPPMIDRSELYKRKHKAKTIGRFSYIELSFGDRSTLLEDGDYLVLSGTSLKYISEQEIGSHMAR